MKTFITLLTLSTSFASFAAPKLVCPARTQEVLRCSPVKNMNDSAIAVEYVSSVVLCQNSAGKLAMLIASPKDKEASPLIPVSKQDRVGAVNYTAQADNMTLNLSTGIRSSRFTIYVAGAEMVRTLKCK